MFRKLIAEVTGGVQARVLVPGSRIGIERRFISGRHFSNCANNNLRSIIPVQKKDGELRKHFSSGSSVRFRKASASDADPADAEEEYLGKGDKVLRVKLASSRLDGILKAGLQISKNKIEKAFYEDRIRLNGQRPRKKSQSLTEGDEIDIVRGSNKLNPSFLDVSRVEIVKLGEEEMAGDDDEGSGSDSDSDSKISAVLKRYKSLTIENYEDPWKGPVVES